MFALNISSAKQANLSGENLTMNLPAFLDLKGGLSVNSLGSHLNLAKLFIVYRKTQWALLCLTKVSCDCNWGLYLWAK